MHSSEPGSTSLVATHAVMLLNGKKEELSVGSKILVSQEIRDAILPYNVA